MKQHSQDTASDRPLASYIIVFMVRAIASNYCKPFGYFASQGFTSQQLYYGVWEAI